MTPEQFSEEQAQKLIRLYVAAEVDILKEINRGLAKGNNVKYLRSMRRNVHTILVDLLEDSRTWCDKTMPGVIEIAAKDIDKRLGSVAGSFGKVNQRAAAVLAENAYGRFEDVTALIGRRTDDIYRKMALEAIRSSTFGYKAWKPTARRFRDDLAERGITGFVDRTGREWNMKTYCEMVTRTTTMEAHLEGTKNRLLEHGYDLIRISSHTARVCPKCEPWQGRVLSLTGQTEGYPTLDEARADGLFHPNCRHVYSTAIVT